jgi:hypothetical protein
VESMPLHEPDCTCQGLTLNPCLVSHLITVGAKAAVSPKSLKRRKRLRAKIRLSLGLLGAEFSLLPAEIVSPATSASVRVGRISRPTCPTYLEEQSVLLGQLLLHRVGYGHRKPLTSHLLALSYIIAVDVHR